MWWEWITWITWFPYYKATIWWVCCNVAFHKQTRDISVPGASIFCVFGYEPPASWANPSYPLVMTDIAIENHHFLSENSRTFDWAMFNSYVSLPKGTWGLHGKILLLHMFQAKPCITAKWCILFLQFFAWAHHQYRYWSSRSVPNHLHRFHRAFF